MNDCGPRPPSTGYPHPPVRSQAGDTQSQRHVRQTADCGLSWELLEECVCLLLQGGIHGEWLGGVQCGEGAGQIGECGIVCVMRVWSV